MRGFIVVLGISLASAWPCAGDETPRHSIAVMGEAELVTPPDYATVEVGVITQGPAVAGALAENSARMSKVIDALHTLGIADKDIQTSDFNIVPKYQKRQDGDYDSYEMRPIVGYSIANQATVTVTDMSRIARIVDASVDAGANASGRVDFRVRNLTDKLDRTRQAAVENARHKAAVLSTAANMKLGRALSITDNQANTNYDSRAAGYQQVESVVSVGGGHLATPILSGQITLTSQVTVVYATD